MVKVNIYRNTEKQYDIVILDFERHLSWTEYEYASTYLYVKLSHTLTILLGPPETADTPIPTDDDITPCMEYRGIALKLVGLIKDKNAALEEFLSAAYDILDYFDT